MSEPTFKIPQEIINPIIQAHVNKAVIEALDGDGKVVTAAILTVLNMCVDSNGNPTTSTYNSRPWIDHVIGKAIRSAAEGAILKMVSEHQQQVEAALMDQLKKKNSPLLKQMLSTMTNGLVSAVTDKWRFNVTFGKDN